MSEIPFIRETRNEANIQNEEKGRVDREESRWIHSRRILVKWMEAEKPGGAQTPITRV